MGDFNSVIDSTEKMGGKPVHSKDFQNFVSCITDAGIFDLKWKGIMDTWRN